MHLLFVEDRHCSSIFADLVNALLQFSIFFYLCLYIYLFIFYSFFYLFIFYLFIYLFIYFIYLFICFLKVSNTAILSFDECQNKTASLNKDSK